MCVSEKVIRIKSQDICTKERHPEDIISNLCEYVEFINEAYKAIFLWCGRFRDALMETVGKKLLYDSGKNKSNETTLTDTEFCKILTDLLERHKGKSLNYPRMWPNIYGVEEDYE